LDVIQELHQLPVQQHVFFAVAVAVLGTVVTLIKQLELVHRHVSVADLHNAAATVLYSDVIVLQ
jgi:hypothetical protein